MGGRQGERGREGEGERCESSLAFLLSPAGDNRLFLVLQQIFLRTRAFTIASPHCSKKVFLLNYIHPGIGFITRVGPTNACNSTTDRYAIMDS